MAPRRRSSRIAGPSTPARNHAVPVTSKLSSLLERDESPQAAQHTIDALISSPLAPNTAPNPARFGSLTSTLTTPQHGSRILPPRSEMHPSKAQLSTMKPSQIANPLGSHPSNSLARSPSKIAIATPSKRPSTAPRTSSTFDFSFEKPESDLSSEARKIMNSVREEAAKIKAQMMAEQKKQQNSDEEAKQLFGVGERQIKKAKGRSGRFSDLHRQEFKKMDSIANHASTWKNKIQGTSETSLKRSPSKAGLDQQAPGNLPRSKSSGTLNETGNDRLENSLPSKRARRDLDEDTSAARPSSRDDTTTTKIPLNGLPSAVSTPTKSSLARSASVKSLKTSMIPSLTRSRSTRTLADPSAPQTEPSNKRLGSWAKLGGNMKSILHRAQPKFSNDPVKVAAGTHLPATLAQANLDKDLPNLPDTPTIKRVDFSNSTKSRHELAALPSKIPTSKSMQSLPRPQSSSSQAAHSSLERDSEQIHYPDLTASPLITTTRGRSPKASIPALAPATPTPSAGPGDFTFRADTSISFKETPAESKDDSNPASFTSPNGTRTIRPVRPSGVPTYMMPGAYDSTPFIAAPPISHGLSNKKRKHANPDTESDIENVDPHGNDPDKPSLSDEEDDGRAKKKLRTGSEAPETMMMSGRLQKKSRVLTKSGSPTKRRMTGAGGATTPKKGGLSLARLNMLARPKERR